MSSICCSCKEISSPLYTDCIVTHSFMVVGMRFCGGHKFKKSDIITFEPEPSNTYDKNVIKVMVDGIHKAYVAKDKNPPQMTTRGFQGLSMCSDKLLKKIGGKISRKLTPEEKDSKFIKEETTTSLGLAIIPLTFTFNVKNNARLSNKKSITIQTEVLVEKYIPKLPNYILLGDKWFYDLSHANVKKRPKIIESVDKRDIHDFYKILPGKSKDESKTQDSVSSLSHRSNISATFDSDSSSNSDTSNSSSFFISSSESEDKHIYKTVAVIRPK
ncbi:hypothetical protein Glove_456g42 [Diversispora epigaea]|uniref:Uncharacterized protein n=1 Tax=Diversispora epigaea TaxID=1348612 RepID=A0A397GP85_9GLOM|nr:hypothetical protein Glove_456g42 [Diversispora epigaea]